VPEVVRVMEKHGSPGTNTYITDSMNSWYCAEDRIDPTKTNGPIYINSTDPFSYSYWMSQYLEITGSDFIEITNIKVYSDGNMTAGWGLTGGGVFIGKRDTGDNGCPQASYAVATGTPGRSGNPMGDATYGHPYYKGQTPFSVNIDTYTAKNMLVIDSTKYTAAFNSKMWVTQMKVPNSVSRCPITKKTIVISYQITY